MTQRYYYRMGAMAAFVGTVLLLLGTPMHPSHADPNDAAAAFAEYAADQHWIASHLAQLLGLGLLMVVLMILARFFCSDLGIVLTEVGKTGAIISIAVGAVLQAVDGIAIKAMRGIGPTPRSATKRHCLPPVWGCAKLKLAWPAC